jgi:clathrin heavy chain
MVVQVDAKMALSIYLRASSTEKVINCFLQTGEYSKIIAYVNKVGFAPDYVFMLQNLVRQNPKGGEEFAKLLAGGGDGGAVLVDLNAVVEVFMQMNRIPECTSFLLDALKQNRKEEGYLQTRLLEINLQGGAPQVADMILASDMFSHFDKPRVAGLCEKSGLFQRALELYTDIADIKRVCVNTHQINHEFLVNYFGSMTAENCMDCLKELLNYNVNVNKQIVVQVAKNYTGTNQLDAKALVTLFEEFKCFDAIFWYLGAIVNQSQDPFVHFNYIKAASQMNNMKEVERVCRDSAFYDAKEVKDYLMDAKLADPRPLIHVCDRHEFEDELTNYLYSNGLLKYIEVYVQKVAPAKTPKVIGKLLDLDCNEDFITQLLNSVRNMCPVDPLVEEVERRNRLRLLQPWLEARIAEGNTEAPTHNAIGKLYILLNKEPQQFLLHNQFYDSKVVGAFCEKLDPFLAYLAYKRAWGACDDELIEVTNKNSLFKDQSRYLVERQDAELWARVLTDENEHKRSLVDEVVATALPESKNPDQVSTTVKAFMAADMPSELIELLEKIVLQTGGEFANNRNLQNLLILQAIKAAPDRVMDYIARLDNFDGTEIANIAKGDQYKLYEEAFEIYKKVEQHEDAIDVLLELIGSIERGFEYAERVSLPAVWSKQGIAQLNNGLVHEAVESFIKADDPAQYKEVSEACGSQSLFEDLVRFLTMARLKVKEKFVDSELIYAYAKTGQLAELEEFISSPNVGDIQVVGERLFEDGMYDAAKLLFNNNSNFSMLAQCYVHLGSFREAVDAAGKANSVRTWKEVNSACVTAGDFHHARICGLHIIANPDHLEELIVSYERLGHFEELIELLEHGRGQESAHSGIFTELGVLYSKYKPDKLMEHIQVYWSRVNVAKLLRACEQGYHWQEAVFLYKETEEFDQAVNTMIHHSAACFDEAIFTVVIQKVRNQELYYDSIKFYLDEQPRLLEKLLVILTPKLEPTQVVQLVRRLGHSALIMPYLRSVQNENIDAVNQTINETLVEDEEYDGLRQSIDEYDNFDQISLAQKIEKHELLEFRRIAADLYKRNERFEQSVSLSKADKMYKDAIDTAGTSRKQEIAEELLKFFISVDDKEVRWKCSTTNETDRVFCPTFVSRLCTSSSSHTYPHRSLPPYTTLALPFSPSYSSFQRPPPPLQCFAACLYTCYDLIRPDVALELAWKNGVMDMAMPFLIQVRGSRGQGAQRTREGASWMYIVSVLFHCLCSACFTLPLTQFALAPIPLTPPPVPPFSPSHTPILSSYGTPRRSWTYSRSGPRPRRTASRRSRRTTPRRRSTRRSLGTAGRAG